MQVETHILAQARSLAQTKVIDKPIELLSTPGFFLARMEDMTVLAAAHFVDELGKTYKVGPKID